VQELRSNGHKITLPINKESKMRKSVILIITCISLLIFVVACKNSKEGSSSGETVVITFWHSFVSSTIPAFIELINRFEKEYPGIKINAQYIPTGDALIQKLITAIQSNTAPDISWLHSDFIEDLVEANAIYKMEDFINGDDGISKQDIDDIYPALIQFSSWRGTLYSLPMEATNLALLYNKKMFRDAGLDPESPPKSWEQLHDFALRLSYDVDNDGNFEQTGFFVPIFPAAGPLGSWMVWQWMPYLWQAGGYFIKEDQSEVLYNSKAGVDALTLWQDLFLKQNLKTFTTDADVAFVANRLAMTMDGPWNLPRYKDLLKNIDWAFAPLPSGRVKSATVVGGEYLAIFKQSKFPKEAWKFLKWMIKPETQAFWSMKSGYLPIRHAVLNVPEFKEYLKQHPNFKVFVDQMKIGQAQRPLDYGNLEITRHIAEAIEKATIGNLDVQTSLNQSAENSNQLLNSIRDEKSNVTNK
jgi:multiple sugar transport system substrate-binding protein